MNKDLYIEFLEKETQRLRAEVKDLTELKDQYRRNIKWLKRDIWDMGKMLIESEVEE